MTTAGRQLRARLDAELAHAAELEVQRPEWSPRELAVIVRPLPSRRVLAEQLQLARCRCHRNGRVRPERSTQILTLKVG